MKHLIYITLALAAGALASGCQSSGDYGELPQQVASFVSQYWADPDVASWVPAPSGGGTVTVRGGASVTFGEDMGWVKIDGNGLPLPQNLLFNVCPERLYKYLEGGGYLGQVFVLTRDARSYTVSLLSETLVYDIASGSVSGS